jgi:uncharacterized membrane protein
MSGKTIAIIAYITIVGWVVALILNSNERSSFAAFHIRQMLGIIIMFMLTPIPIIGWAISVFAVVCWVIGIVGAVSERETPVPFAGEHFQKWFAAL